MGIGARRRKERRAGGGRSRSGERGQKKARRLRTRERSLTNATDGHTARTQNQRKRGKGEEKSRRETPRPGRRASLDTTTAIIIDGRIKNKKNTTETKGRARTPNDKRKFPDKLPLPAEDRPNSGTKGEPVPREHRRNPHQQSQPHARRSCPCQLHEAAALKNTRYAPKSICC